MIPELEYRADGDVACNDGWAVRFVAPDLLEYRHGDAACLINVDYAASERTRRIYVSESSSDLFPQLLEHMQSALGHFKGRYVVV
jgi:hypothetical protein